MTVDFNCWLAVGLALVIGTGGLAVAAHGQSPPGGCRVETKSNAPKYRVGRDYRTVKGPPTLVLQVSVEPGCFTRDAMTQLARRLNKDFAREPRLQVILFSDRRAARDFIPSTHSPTYERDWAAMRGGYHLDRAAGEEYIQFSPDPDRPRDEIRIQLAEASRPPP